MNLESTINKILNPVEKNATLLGAVLAVLPGISEISDSVTQIMQGHIHAPNVSNLFTDLTTDPNMRTAAIAAILGYIGEGATSNRTIQGISTIAKNAGVGYLAAGASVTTLYLMTHADLGCDKDGFTKPPVGSSNVKTSGLDFIRSS